MRSYTLRLILAIVTIVSSVLAGLYIDSRAFAFAFIGFWWAVHCLVKLSTGEREEKAQSFRETFDTFYEGSKDGSDQSTKQD